MLLGHRNHPTGNLQQREKSEGQEVKNASQGLKIYNSSLGEEI